MRAVKGGKAVNPNFSAKTTYLGNWSDANQAKEIVAAAHQVCPYSNATRGNIDVELIANGEPVD